MRGIVAVAAAVGLAAMLAGCKTEMSTVPLSPMSSTTMETQDLNLLRAVQAQPNMTTFYRLVNAADLQDTLTNGGPYTVFAPTDEAFGQLPAGRIDELLKPENKAELTELLKFHIVNGIYSKTDLAGLENLITIEGKWLDVQVSDETTRVNNIALSGPEIKAHNGVILPVERVLMP